MKRLIHLTLFLTFAMTACNWTAAPQTPSAVPSSTPGISAEVPSPTPTSAEAANATGYQVLLQQAQTADSKRYQFTVEQGAQILPTDDGKSFYVLWLPPNSDPANPPPMIVTLHGHGSWAFDEFFLWHSYAAERGYGILALQWWFGQGETASDYYTPEEMYSIFESVLSANHVQPQTVLFHGFSRASANTYGLTALDRASGNDYFLLTISNAGRAADDYPINQSIEQGVYGSQPFANTHWFMVCGMNDPNPDRDGCPAMRSTRDWVTQFGGSVDLLIEDPNGDHGAFHRNPDNVDAALDVFAHLLGENP